LTQPTGDDAQAHGEKEIRKRLENDGLEHKEETESTGLVEKVLVRKKRRRLPSLERLRHELVYQLRESLRATQEKMNNPELSLAERHHWTQVHTYTAQVLNTILRDLQLKDWEKRLKELEQRGLTNKTLPPR
jgi:predicted component of type VI protein secretion system